MIPKQKYHSKTGSQYDQENKSDEEHMHVFQEIWQNTIMISERNDDYRL